MLLEKMVQKDLLMGGLLQTFNFKKTQHLLSAIKHVHVIYSFLRHACNNTLKGFPGGSGCKVSAYNAGDPGLIPGLGRSPGEGNGNPLQYSCLEIPWTEEPGKLQYMGLQSQIQLSDYFLSLCI